MKHLEYTRRGHIVYAFKGTEEIKGEILQDLMLILAKDIETDPLYVGYELNVDNSVLGNRTITGYIKRRDFCFRFYNCPTDEIYGVIDLASLL